jgi:hypothetical protein
LQKKNFFFTKLLLLVSKNICHQLLKTCLEKSGGIAIKIRVFKTNLKIILKIC